MFAKKKPLTLYRNPGLYLEQIDGRGRGVFCLEDIKKGDTLEVAPVLIFPTRESPAISTTLTGDYVFAASEYDSKFLKAIGIDDPAGTKCLPLGITSLCNHLVDPNAGYKFMVDDLSPFVTLSARRDIVKGEEITVSYGPAWFVVRHITPGRK